MLNKTSLHLSEPGTLRGVHKAALPEAAWPKSQGGASGLIMDPPGEGMGWELRGTGRAGC